MNVGIVYATAAKQIWLKINVPDGTTAEQAIELSGILSSFPEVDLEEQKLGIFGRVVRPNTPLADGDRVEIYRPITADPETAERRETPNA